MKINKKGFTLIEMLAVVLIIGVLAAVAIPGYMKAMEKSKAVEAIQALSDIAKAENDYYNAQSKYTNDFSDLVLTMVDKNTLEEADHSSYATEFFIYNLDNNQNMATARRDKGADTYTLYKLYDDPRTYCQPEGNKYCEALGLPAGTFTYSIGAWQSCPGGVYPCSMACARNTLLGYSCWGTYNEDGTFTEKVCDSNNLCLTSHYNADQKNMGVDSCYSYDENGHCTKGSQHRYDENGNLLSFRRCTGYSEDGTCTTFNSSYAYEYDENGNRIRTGSCSKWEGDDCIQVGAGAYNYYDENGNLVRSASCQSFRDGVCVRYSNSAYLYEYDENGRQISQRTCSSVNRSTGECLGYSNSGGYVYNYDENGMINSRQCSRWEGNTCVELSNSGGQLYTYDTNGNKTSWANCETWENDGTCTSYNNVTLYTYDNSGRIISEERCSRWDGQGTCSTGYTFNHYDYEYDANGNLSALKKCTSSGVCSGRVVTTSEDGHQILGRYCSRFAADGSCEQYGNDVCLAGPDANPSGSLLSGYTC